MANKEITDLTTQATYDGTYYVAVDDTGFAEAKKMTLAVLTGTEATAREAFDDAIVAGVGLESDGSFDETAGSNYLKAADYVSAGLSETVKNGLTLLDTQIKANTDALAGYSGVTYSKITISGESVGGLNAVPYTLVAAPGDGYCLDPISVVGFIDYSGGALEVGTNDILIRTATSGDTLATLTNAWYEASSDKIEKAVIADNCVLRNNEGLELYCAADDSGGTSTSTIYIYISYRAIEL